MRNFSFLSLLALGVASAASAQIDPFSQEDPADSQRPKTSYPIGDSQAVAHAMVLAMHLEQRQQDLCWKLGCLVIVNETRNFNVTGFYVDTSDGRGERKWSSNQFGRPLFARKATFRFKTGDPTSCDRPVLFVLKQPKTKDVLKVETRASLCTAPHVDSLVRVNVVRPEVIVEEGRVGQP
jgi:hypothetical protein